MSDEKWKLRKAKDMDATALEMMEEVIAEHHRDLLLNITALTDADKAIEKAIEHIDNPARARRYLRKAQRALKELVGVADVCTEADAPEKE